MVVNNPGRYKQEAYGKYTTTVRSENLGTKINDNPLYFKILPYVTSNAEVIHPDQLHLDTSVVLTEL